MLENYFKKVTDKSGQADRISTEFSVQMLEPEITPFFYSTNPRTKYYAEEVKNDNAIF